MDLLDDSSLQLSISSSDLLRQVRRGDAVSLLPRGACGAKVRPLLHVAPLISAQSLPNHDTLPRPRRLSFFCFHYINILPSLLIVLLVCLWPLFPFSPAAARLPLFLLSLSLPPLVTHPPPPTRSLFLSEAPASILSVGVLRLHAGPLHYAKQFDQLFSQLYSSSFSLCLDCVRACVRACACPPAPQRPWRRPIPGTATSSPWRCL